MKSRKLTSATSLLALATLIALGSCGSEDVPEATDEEETAPIRWKMTSTFSSSLTMLGSMGKRIEEQLLLISGGDIEIKFYEPGALAPALEGFDAVSYGAIEAGWSTSGYWAGKEPALQLFGAVPFGPDAPEYMAWYYFGGGQPLFEEIYARHNIHGIICGITPPEASGWYNKRFESVDDFRGMKVRFFGLGALVMEKMGANAQLLAGGDIMPALELGTIDGAEFSMPAVDYDVGFWQVAKYYYFPGWHQQSTFFELIINLEEWQKLNAVQQAQINLVCGDNMRHGIARGEAIQMEALDKIVAKGVSLEVWPDHILEALEAAWNEVVIEQAAANEDFARVWDSLSRFRSSYVTWRELGYLK